MINDFYTKSGQPASRGAGSSATMRAQFALIEAGFDKLPALTGTSLKVWRTNTGETAAEAVDIGSLLSLDVAFTGDISPSQITANQDDYNPTGLSTASVLRLSTDASRNITGLQGGADGRIIIIHNVGSFNIVLTDSDAASTAAYRFALQADMTILPDWAIMLQYDSTSSRWRAIGLQASAFMQTVLSAASAAAALTALGAASSTNPDYTTQALTWTVGGTTAWDMASGGIATVTAGAGNTTMGAPSNLKKGTYILKVTQDGTGSRTITWNSVFKWTAGTPPVLSTAASAIDVISFFCDGTNLYGSLAIRGAA